MDNSYDFGFELELIYDKKDIIVLIFIISLSILILILFILIIKYSCCKSKKIKLDLNINNNIIKANNSDDKLGTLLEQLDSE